MLIHLIVQWFVAALALYIVARVIPGIVVRGFGDALVAAAVIAIVNVTLGPILRIISFPITILTLGLFRLVINAILLKVAAAFSPGFRIVGFLPAVLGSIVLTIVTYVLQYIVHI